MSALASKPNPPSTLASGPKPLSKPASKLASTLASRPASGVVTSLPIAQTDHVASVSVVTQPRTQSATLCNDPLYETHVSKAFGLAVSLYDEQHDEMHELEKLTARPSLPPVAFVTHAANELGSVEPVQPHTDPSNSTVPPALLQHCLVALSFWPVHEQLVAGTAFTTMLQVDR